MASKHDGPKDKFFNCPKCGKLFQHELEVEKHDFKHHSTYKCFFCSISLELHSKLVKHINDFHCCKHCRAMYKTTDDLKLHMHVKHFGSSSEELFVCTACTDENCVFLDKNELQAHLVLKHQIKEECQQKTSYKILTEKKEIDEIILNILNKEFELDENLLKEPVFVPKKPKELKTPKASKKPNELKTAKGSKKPKGLKTQKGSQKPKVLKKAKEPIKVKSQKRKYSKNEATDCPKCEQKFQKTCDMHVHLREEHSSCHVCDLVIFDQVELAKHITEHEIPTIKIKTNLKGKMKKVSTAGSLKHKLDKQVEGEKAAKKKKTVKVSGENKNKFKCKICEICFPTLDDVRKHIPVHFRDLASDDIGSCKS